MPEKIHKIKTKASCNIGFAGLLTPVELFATSTKRSASQVPLVVVVVVVVVRSEVVVVMVVVVVTAAFHLQPPQASRCVLQLISDLHAVHAATLQHAGQLGPLTPCCTWK